jgi:5-methylcytosine-specific restriction endonuclease McrA
MRECALCGDTGKLSIHHILPRSQGGDDVKENLIALCGDGVSGDHGDVEHRRGDARRALGLLILSERKDTLGYLAEKFGTQDRALAWLERNLLS